MNETELKKDLSRHLRGGEAFPPLEELMLKIPYSDLGIKPAGLPYSFFELFSHIRFTQKDILDYCTRKSYKAPSWPDAYWPAMPAPENPRQWQDLQERYFREREALIDYMCHAETDVTSKVPSSGDHSLFRELLLVIEHTSYHTGQLLILLRHLGHY